MAEAILAGIAEGIIGQLGNAAVKEIGLLWGLKDELDRLEDTVTTIKGVLADAEKQQSHSDQIKIWLQRLEDVVYEADDLVDEFSTEALRLQVMSGGEKLKQVRTFCSPSNQFVFRLKMGCRIRHIRKKLDFIADDKKFHLESGLGLGDTKLVSPGDREAHSFVQKEEVVGRDDEKMAIMKLIFDIKTDENIGVIAIVGLGGLGKTTLAQLVFNDEKVKEQFKLVMWANVPKDFDVKLVVKQIMESGEKDERSLDQLQKDLQEKLQGKRYFLVLDDVWNESREKWLKLENLLRGGAYGSRIIVTTRSIKVADVVRGTMKPYLLGVLDSEKSWDLFKKLAFKPGQDPKDSKIVEIAKEITEKCGGIPLVIRTIGSMLYSMDQEEWSSFNEKELSKASEYKDDIIPRLKLSYDRLPSHLKHCFTCCSLFPKNYEIDVQNLIHLWMAQGFIKLPSDSHQHLEDVGYEHFRDLLWRSFFQEVKFDEFSRNVSICKMHDCMHDLAMSIAGKRNVMLSLNDANNKIDKRTFHVSFNFIPRDLRQQLSTSADHATRIRTIFFPCTFNSFRNERQSIDGLLDFGLKFLRTLDLHDSNIKILPNSIDKMKHLRYLDLSWNEEMEALPDSITRLVNLQTLDLSHCTSLRALPGGITKLVNLRHLITLGTGLTCMPRGIGQLTNLQTLSQFVVDDDTTSASRHPSGELNELENLNSLRGHLQITVNKDGVESTAANLKNKPNLHGLELEIGGTIVDNGEGFLPHSNLKYLRLSGKNIHLCVPLLKCVPSLTSLVRFVLMNHKECQYLPPLDHLPCLKELYLIDLPALEYISSNNDNNFFSSLQKLTLLGMPNLKGWWKLDVMNIESNASLATNIETTIPFFPCLSRLGITDCPKLICMPLYPYLQELSLDNTSLISFERTSMMINVGGQTWNQASSSSTVHLASDFLPLSKLEILRIKNVELECLPDQGFKSLAFMQLTIENCGALQSLSLGIQHLASLKELRIENCGALQSLSPGIQHLLSLKELTIKNCGALQSLSPGIQHLASLKELTIKNCGALQSLSPGIQHLASLKRLTIKNCGALQSLSPGIQHLTSLEDLHIEKCEQLDMSAAATWQNLGSLHTLYIGELPKLVALPEGLQQVTSLQNIIIWECNNLVDIMECISSLNSLKELYIWDCPNLRSLPEGIDCLPSFGTLHIQNCPILLEKCRKDTGVYWPMIRNIKQLDVDTSLEDSTSSRNIGRLFNCFKI